jgi:nicotinamide-nucleotide amidase
MNTNSTIIDILRQRKETIAVAESVTGGEIAAKISEVPGASDIFLGGVVAYSIASKIRDLDVSAKIIEEFGVYSETVAAEMARGIRSRFDSDWAIGITGVAGPGPDDEVAPGSIWIAILGPAGVQNLQLSLTGTRQQIRNGAVTSALATLERILTL